MDRNVKSDHTHYSFPANADVESCAAQITSGCFEYLPNNIELAAGCLPHYRHVTVSDSLPSRLAGFVEHEVTFK